MKLPNVLASGTHRRRAEPVRGVVPPPRPASAWWVRALAVLAVTPVLRGIVAAHSVPAGRPRVSACPACKTPVGLTGPLSALFPLARCAGCSARIGAPPFMVELAALAVAGVLVLAARHGAGPTGLANPTGLVGPAGPADPTGPAVATAAGRSAAVAGWAAVAVYAAIAWWAACAIPLALIDIAVHRLPDRLTYPAAAGTGGMLGLAALLAADPSAGLRALIAGAGAALALAASTLLLGRRGFGLGDAKLALSGVALLGWFGWGWVVSGLMVTFAGSALCGLALLATRRIRWSGHLPFGPFLVLGTLVTVALSAGAAG